MWLCCMNLQFLAGLFSCFAFWMLESSLGLIFERMSGDRLLGFGAFFAALFCGFRVHLVWCGGMYARFWRAYVVATEV